MNRKNKKIIAQGYNCVVLNQKKQLETYGGMHASAEALPYFSDLPAFNRLVSYINYWEKPTIRFAPAWLNAYIKEPSIANGKELPFTNKWEDLEAFATGYKDGELHDRKYLVDKDVYKIPPEPNFKDFNPYYKPGFKVGRLSGIKNFGAHIAPNFFENKSFFEGLLNAVEGARKGAGKIKK